MSMTQPTHDDSVPQVEPDTVPRRTFWLTGVVAVVIIVFSIFVSNEILRAAGGSSTRPSRPPPHAPDQIDIVEQTLIRNTRRGADEQATQKESLRHFGWIDKAHGIAKIPIDRAMDLAADPAFMRRAFEIAAPAAEAGTKEGI